MLLHKQQSTDGQLLYTVVSSRLKTSTILVTRLTVYWRNVKSVQDMIRKDRRRTKRHVAKCLKLSYGTTHRIISDVLSYSRVAHAGCQECWLLKSRMYACKLPVVVSTCTWQILSSFFVDMWPMPWMMPAFTILMQKWNDKVYSGSTQPCLQLSSFERPQWPQDYGVCILG